MHRFHSPRLLFVAALGATLAMLALPSFAAARARGHHHANRHARHHLITRAHGRMVLIHGTASNSPGSPAGTGQENAGEVESFDGTTLTIKLFAGGTVSGKVTESTEIECEHQSTEAQASEDGQESQNNQGEDQQSGDQSQQSSDQSQQSGDQGDSSDTEDQSSSSSCGTAALVPGAIVHEAELDVTSGGAVFQSVDLAS